MHGYGSVGGQDLHGPDLWHLQFPSAAGTGLHPLRPTDSGHRSGLGVEQWDQQGGYGSQRAETN